MSFNNCHSLNLRWLILLFSFISLSALLAQEDDEYIVKVLKEHNAEVFTVSFSPDNQYLVSGGDDKQLIVWSTETLEPVYKYENNYYPPRAIEVTAENKMFIASGPDIKLVDLQNNNLAVYKGNTTHIWSVDYAAERNKLIAGSFDKRVREWDVSSSNISLELEGHLKSTLPVAFSPDEKYILTGSLDKSLKIWNALTGECIKTLELHSDNIYDVKFHPSGKYFASASRDKTIRLWNFETGKVIRTFTGHDQAIMCICFLPDGNHLLSGSLDGSIRLWETRTGKLVYTFTGHTGAVNSIAINFNGEYFATGGADFKLIYWKLDHKIFVEYAYANEFESEKSKLPLFNDKGKGEKKQDYDLRMQTAKQLESEMVEKYYKLYMEGLKKLSFEMP